MRKRQKGKETKFSKIPCQHLSNWDFDGGSAASQVGSPVLWAGCRGSRPGVNEAVKEVVPDVTVYLFGILSQTRDVPA